MLQLIFQWLITAIGAMVEALLTLFMNALDMDMNTYITLFPFLTVGYKVFRGIGIGLAASLSVFSLLKFFVPAVFGAKEPQDTVPGVLLKTFTSGALIYGGNFILVKIVEIAKIPYDVFLNADAVTVNNSSSFFSWDFLTRIAETFTGLEAGLIVFEFCITVVVAWNLIKLMLEVCERFMIVGILVYTSPPFFAMAAATETFDSFLRWIKMFLSSCVMMSVSVFFLKLILSGFSIMNGGLSESGAHTFLRMLLLLATCKIAQRADSYLSHLGFGTAHTGGALVDDIIAAGRTIGSVLGTGFSGSGKASYGRHTVLGAAADAMSANGGFAGKAVDTVRAGVKSYAEGDTKDDIYKNMSDAAKNKSIVPENIRAVGKIAKAGKDAGSVHDAASAIGRAAINEGAGLAASVLETATPYLHDERLQNIEDKESAAVTEAEIADEETSYLGALSDKEFAGASMPDMWDKNMELRSIALGKPDTRTANDNFAKYGAIDPDTGESIRILDGGEILPSVRAKASGVDIQPHEKALNSGRIITGSPAAVSEVISAGYNPSDAFPADLMQHEADRASLIPKFESMAVDTINLGSPEIADRILHNPNIDIQGTEGIRIGRAAVSRLYPDLIQSGAEMTDIRTFDAPKVIKSGGKEAYGGHIWQADIKTAEGNFRYTSLDRTAFSRLNAEERKSYTRRDLSTGRVEYIKRDVITDEMRRDIGHSHYVRKTARRLRTDNSPIEKPAGLLNKNRQVRKNNIKSR